MGSKAAHFCLWPLILECLPGAKSESLHPSLCSPVRSPLCWVLAIEQCRWGPCPLGIDFLLERQTISNRYNFGSRIKCPLTMHEREGQEAGCLECDSRRDSDLVSWDLKEKSSPRNLELTEGQGGWGVYPPFPCLSLPEGFFLRHSLSITLALPACDLSLLLRPEIKPQRVVGVL